MNENAIDQNEIAASLYDDLLIACNMKHYVRSAYAQLNRTFLVAINESTQFDGVRFNGAFAKTDYLLKEYHAPKELRLSVNGTRIRLRNLAKLDDKQLTTTFLSDLKAVAQLIALVFKQPIPQTLQAVLPKQISHKLWKTKADYLRVIVNRFDDDYIYGTANDGGAEELKIRYTQSDVLHVNDYSYLKEFLSEGTQLNIVRPHEDEGVLCPEIIVYEPDFLVDISSVASCFESYAESPLCYLINKIKRVDNTPAIMLGHFASQFLDDELYDKEEEAPYIECAKKFFCQHALGLIEADIDHNFHAEARRQRQHIHAALRQTLPTMFANSSMTFNSSDLMVEPTFFSEMLGLQGRVDLLQLDQRLIIEQKSGKGGFPQPNPDTPSAQEKHFVQLLLYALIMRYNFRKQYQLNNNELHSFLFYSKYPNGLLNMGYAPQLVQRAIKLRNTIAANEYHYSQHGFQRLLELTPDDLRQKNVNETFWNRYIYPQLSSLLSPLHEASELERSYCLRLLKFVQTEHILAKIGSQSKENSGFADKWYSSLSDKLQAGNIYINLEMLSPRQSQEGRVDQVVFALDATTESDVSNFRCGDIVIFYPYRQGTEPDACQTMVFRASIEELNKDTITLHLRASQTNARAFWHRGHHKWAVEHDFFDSSFASLYRGVYSFLSAPKHRRDLLLLQRKPSVDHTLTLNGHYGGFDELALRVKQANDLFLIIGPPGTGKTSFGLVNTLKEQLTEGNSSVLLLSYTNRAVDEICEKLVECGYDFIRIGSRFSCSKPYKEYLLDEHVSHCSNVAQLKQVIKDKRIFVGTTTAYNSSISLFNTKQFELAIIDEASQILEPHLLGLLSATDGKGEVAIRKIVMIGDHKQLPAVVQQSETDSRVDDCNLKAICLDDCRLSLFERLLKAYKNNPETTYMLTRQGRMHVDIADYPNKAFYQNLLKPVPLPHQQEMLTGKDNAQTTIERLLNSSRIAFVDVGKPAESLSEKVNVEEAELIAQTVVRIYSENKLCFSPSQSVGVIVPYRNQISAVRRAIASYNIAQLSEITIDTVERFQGSQRDYIVYGFTVQKVYQLGFLTNNVFTEEGCIVDRKLNVAMTRARKHLIMFGNSLLLCRHIVFRQLINYLKSKNCFFSSL